MGWKSGVGEAVMVVDDVTGVVSASPKRKRVAIVGFASSSRHLAPWTDPGYELWGLNSAFSFFERRPDRWFEVHRGTGRTESSVPDYTAALNALECPVYIAEPIPGLRHGVPYPIEWVQTMAPAPMKRYLTSSMALMIALAIAYGFEEIAVYGVDCTVGSEYEEQKACIEAWLMYAQGRGIAVHIPEESALFKATHVYGLEPVKKWPKELRANTAFLESRIATHQQHAQDAYDQSLKALGGAEALRDLEALLPDFEPLKARIIEYSGAAAAQWDRHKEISGAIMELTTLLSFAESKARGANFKELDRG